MIQQNQEQREQSVQSQALGREINDFPIRFQLINRWLVLILGIILLVDAILFALISTFNLWHAIQAHGRAILLVKITNPLIAVCLILPIGILLILLAAMNWQNSLTLYENGLIIRRQNRENTLLWDSIERFDNQITIVKFSGTTITARRRIILEDDQTKRLIIHNRYDHMDEMIAQLRRLILPGLFKKADRKLRQGGEISFQTNLAARKEGLRIKDFFVPWHGVQVHADKKGKILITQQVDQQVLMKLKSNQIKNFDVLLHLIDNPPDPRY